MVDRNAGDGLRPTLRGRDVLALTVGIVIGAGIFRAPSTVAGFAPGQIEVLIAWVAGGLLSMIGALCYAELASTYPNVGGDLHFLERAFGRRLAFLYGWARMTVIQTGSIVILAYVFGDYLASIAPAGAFGPMLYAGGAVLALSFANWAGVKLGSQVQLWLTVLEVGGLVALIVAAFSLAPAESVGAAANAPASANWGLMLVFVLFTYSGWNEVAYVSAEVRGPPRRIGVLIVAGLAAVSLLYLLANVALLRALGVAGVAAAPAVGSEIMQRAWGPAGAAFIALIVAVAALTSANATAITGARSNCALGRSVPAMRWLGHWHEDRGTPANAILVQGAIALLLVAIGGFARDGFKTAIDYTAPVFWFFLLLVGLSLFVLRMREPTRERPFRVPLYPLLPALFCATSLYLLYSSIAYTGFGALVGVAVLAAGALLLPLLRPAAQLERMHEDTR